MVVFDDVDDGIFSLTYTGRPNSVLGSSPIADSWLSHSGGATVVEFDVRASFSSCSWCPAT